MSKLNCLFLLISVIQLSNSFRASKLSDAYINQYKEIAVSEMHRTGIPASIKLAQGLLESDWGRSDLANIANNHFGIKCGNYWRGESFFKEDDDYHQGEIIASCFRKYASAQQSYIDHSEFLAKARYQKLFNLNTKDYHGWAKGLKEAGYATDPEYPSKLISIIEKYELYLYDEPVSNEVLIAYDDQEYDEGSEVYRSQHVETIEIEGPRISRESYRGQKYHRVAENERMEDIARLHDIDLNALYAKNRMPIGSQALAGELIKLQGKVSLESKPKYVRFPNHNHADSIFLF